MAKNGLMVEVIEEDAIESIRVHNLTRNEQIMLFGAVLGGYLARGKDFEHALNVTAMGFEKVVFKVAETLDSLGA